MSEYRKLKITATKVGVTMAFLALLAGIAEATGPGPATVTVMPAAAVTQANAQVAQVLKGKSALKLKSEPGTQGGFDEDRRRAGAAGV